MPHNTYCWINENNYNDTAETNDLTSMQSIDKKNYKNDCFNKAKAFEYVSLKAIIISSTVIKLIQNNFRTQCSYD